MDKPTGFYPVFGGSSPSEGAMDCWCNGNMFDCLSNATGSIPVQSAILGRDND